MSIPSSRREPTFYPVYNGGLAYLAYFKFRSNTTATQFYLFGRFFTNTTTQVALESGQHYSQDKNGYPNQHFTVKFTVLVHLQRGYNYSIWITVHWQTGGQYAKTTSPFEIRTCGYADVKYTLEL